MMQMGQDSEFLETLATKRREYINGLRINGFEEGTKRLFSELYPDDAHFLYELLQNAEDAGASEVEFDLRRDHLRFVHDGRDFTPEDVDGITGIGTSLKKDDVNTIGEFGIGFKAVFAFTNSPRIECDSFNFFIDDWVYPRPMSETSSEFLPGRTTFTFPFNKGEKPQAEAFEEIARGFEQLSSVTVLFLHNISVIRWRVQGGDSGDISLSEKDLVCRIVRTERAATSGEIAKTSSDWLRLQPPTESAPKLRVGLAFELQSHDPDKTADLYDTDDGSLGDYWKIVRCKKGMLCVYFPAVKETTGLHFHVNAPFASTIGRDSIPHHNEDNAILRDQLVDLLISSLPRLRDEDLLSEGFLGTMPSMLDSLDDFYQPFREKLKTAFETKPLLATLEGEFRTTAGLYRGSEAFREIFSEEALRVLTRVDNASWVKPVFDSRARNFLREFLEIPEWDEMVLGESISRLWSEGDASDTPAGKWLLGRGPSWLRRFYRLLADKEIHPYGYIILGEDGKLHRPANIYTSPENMEDAGFGSLALIDPVLLNDDGHGERTMSEVLAELGVNQVSEKEVVKVLLRRHDSNSTPQSSTRRGKKHVSRIERFLDYWNSNGQDTSLFRGKRLFLTAEGNAVHKATD